MKYYHYVFKTYKGFYCLVDQRTTGSMERMFNDITKEKNFMIDSMSILGDHVHMLIKQADADAPSYIMKVIKGISAREYFKNNPTNRFDYRKLWGRSLYSEEIDHKDVDRIREYIKGQKIMGEDKRFNLRNREVHSQVPS